MTLTSQKIVRTDGLRIIFVPMPSSNVVTTMFMFGVGSRDETKKNAGISHVLEHMYYKGTKSRPSSLRLAEYVEAIGGEHNAFTAKEYTGFYVKVAANHLEKTFDFLSDLIFNPLFDSEELEKEKCVILQELSMYQDLPMEVAANNFESILFGDNSLGREIIGTKEAILAITKEDLLQYKSHYYQPENSVLVVAGNFEIGEESMLTLINKYFQFSGAKSVARNKLILDDPKLVGLKKRKVEQSHLCIGFPGPSTTDNDRFALRLLSIILGESMSSRMFEEIREKRNLAYAIRTSMTSYVEAGAFETQAGVAHDKIIEALKAIIGQYKAIKKDGVSQDELVKAKEIINGKILIAFEDTEQVANFFAHNQLFSLENLSLDQILLKYNKLTIEDLNRVAKKFINFNKLSVSIVTNKDITRSIAKAIKETL